MKCVICGKPIDVQGTWTRGHNAQPISEGNCCTNCNETKVLPTRKELAKKGIYRDDYGDGIGTFIESSDLKIEDGKVKIKIGKDKKKP